MGYVAFTAVSHEISICKMSLKITFFKLLPHLPGDNELIHWGKVALIYIMNLKFMMHISFSQWLSIKMAEHQ